MFGIIGGGFGLYGYLPAIIKKYGNKVCIEEKNREKILLREELKIYIPYIKWMPNRESLLKESNALVIAVPPFAQGKIIKDVVEYKNIKRLILEKPVDMEPKVSEETINLIEKSKKIARVGYTFLYTEWFDTLMELKKTKIFDLEIEWSFKAHHFTKKDIVWKGIHSEGGGPLRFYGIHIIAVLEYMGYSEPIESALSGKYHDIHENWSARYNTNTNTNNSAYINIKTNHEENRFSIKIRTKEDHIIDICNNKSPFLKIKNEKGEDPRVRVLEKMLDSLNKEDLINTYRRINNLWMRTEEKTSISINNESTN